MRKRIKTKKLSRTTNQRKALFRNLIVALVEHGEIKTTKAKAKAVRSLIEKLITKGKKGTLHSRRLIQRVVIKRQVANKIVDELAKRYAKRQGGYTKMVSLGNRRGDDAPIVKLSLLPVEEKPKTKPKKKSNSAPKAKKTKSEANSAPTPKKLTKKGVQNETKAK